MPCVGSNGTLRLPHTQNVLPKKLLLRGMMRKNCCKRLSCYMNEAYLRKTSQRSVATRTPTRRLFGSPCTPSKTFPKVYKSVKGKFFSSRDRCCRKASRRQALVPCVGSNGTLRCFSQIGFINVTRKTYAKVFSHHSNKKVAFWERRQGGRSHRNVPLLPTQGTSA